MRTCFGIEPNGDKKVKCKYYDQLICWDINIVCDHYPKEATTQMVVALQNIKVTKIKKNAKGDGPYAQWGLYAFQPAIGIYLFQPAIEPI